MEHAAYLIDILDKSGAVIGSKQRKNIDKANDIYKSAHILLVTPRGEAVLSSIKERSDLPNLFPHRYGMTVATILRSGEPAAVSAERAAARELFIDDARIEFIGEYFGATPEDNRTVAASLFTMIGEVPDTFSQTDISGLQPFSRSAINALLEKQPEKFAPLFQVFWKQFSDILPL